MNNILPMWRKGLMRFLNNGFKARFRLIMWVDAEQNGEPLVGGA